MSDRLRLAVENGHAALPEGPVLVVNPGTGSDLSVFDRETACLLPRTASARAVFEDAGWTVGAPPDPMSGAVIFLPRAREAQRTALRLARAHTDGPIVVDGDKTDGIDAFYREVRKRTEVGEAWSKAHGKVFAVTGTEAFGDWPTLSPARSDDGWWRGPGVFSADGVDKASALLAEELPASLSGRVADLGAGWGYLSRAILGRPGVTELHLVEDDLLALAAAELNVTDARAQFHAADALVWRPDEPFDHVVTNPPFHTGRAADPSLGQAFIRAAAAMLTPKGSLWLVANRQLPYEGTLEDAFRTVTPLAQNPSFKLFHARSPKRSRRG